MSDDVVRKLSVVVGGKKAETEPKALSLLADVEVAITKPGLTSYMLVALYDNGGNEQESLSWIDTSNMWELNGAVLGFLLDKDKS